MVRRLCVIFSLSLFFSWLTPSFMQASATTGTASQPRILLDKTMAKAKNSGDLFSMDNWTIAQKRGIALHQAFGISKGTFSVPPLQAELPGAAGHAQHKKSTERMLTKQQQAQANQNLKYGAPGGKVGGTEAQNQALGQRLVADAGWTGQQWIDFNNIVMAESGWSTDAENPSGAYGIPQALPGSKMASAGSNWRTSPRTQIIWMIGYIKGRYGNPSNAWAFHLANGWY